MLLLLVFGGITAILLSLSCCSCSKVLPSRSIFQHYLLLTQKKLLHSMFFFFSALFEENSTKTPWATSLVGTAG
jgi:hypothetical protein